MALQVAMACMLCAVFTMCGASSQNRLARRIASLERTVEGLKADYSRKLDTLRSDLLAELVKQQQQHISESSRQLRREQDKRHELLEKQISNLRVRLDQTGVKGEPGQKGDTGLTGLKGEPGPRGSPGQGGPRGLPGVSGLKGDPGINGRDGRQGSRGPRGLKGSKGVKGQKGERGPTGLKGETGLSRRPNTSIINLDVPVLRFTKVYDGIQGRVFIEAGGAAVRDGPDRAMSIIVRTDGLLTGSRRHYWETELAWDVRSNFYGSLFYWVGDVGVRRQGSNFNRVIVGDGQSWGVAIAYSFNKIQWRYYCYHGGEELPRSRSQPATYTNSTVTNRLGFLLDPANKTLTAVDVNTDTRICSFFGVNTGSQPLVPVVRFAGHEYQRRFRLPAVDPSRLPGPVTDLLHN